MTTEAGGFAGMSEFELKRLERALGAACRTSDSDPKRPLDPVIYWALRRLANSYMRRERVNHTLQPTALVHEALTRLVGFNTFTRSNDKIHFYATTARVMRHVLVDHAKARRTTKRGGNTKQVDVSLDRVGASTDGGLDMVEIDEALEKLHKLNPEAATAMELHYFGALTLEETAQVMDISVSTVTRQIRFAKAWLGVQFKGRLNDEPSPGRAESS